MLFLVNRDLGDHDRFVLEVQFVLHDLKDGLVGAGRSLLVHEDDFCVRFLWHNFDAELAALRWLVFFWLRK